MNAKRKAADIGDTAYKTRLAPKNLERIKEQLASLSEPRTQASLNVLRDAYRDIEPYVWSSGFSPYLQNLLQSLLEISQLVTEQKVPNWFETFITECHRRRIYQNYIRNDRIHISDEARQVLLALCRGLNFWVIRNAMRVRTLSEQLSWDLKDPNTEYSFFNIKVCCTAEPNNPDTFTWPKPNTTIDRIIKKSQGGETVITINNDEFEEISSNFRRILHEFRDDFNEQLTQNMTILSNIHPYVCQIFNRNN